MVREGEPRFMKKTVCGVECFGGELTFRESWFALPCGRQLNHENTNLARDDIHLTHGSTLWEVNNGGIGRCWFVAEGVLLLRS